MLALRALHDTVHRLCSYLIVARDRSPVVHAVGELQLFRELAVCLLGSQVKNEVALTFASALIEEGVLQQLMRIPRHRGGMMKVANVLKLPRSVQLPSGEVRQVSYRFPTAKAHSLALTARRIYGSNLTLKRIIERYPDVTMVRDYLVEECHGIGPKQASLFLRNVGTGRDLAVLDSHVLAYMRIGWGLDVDAKAVSTMARYAEVEQAFRKIAGYFGYPVDIVDIAVWSTIRVWRLGYGIKHRELGVGRSRLDFGSGSNARAGTKAVPIVH